MKFKMRALHFSPAGNAEAVANGIARSQACNCDKIPPAYPIENEKLCFVVVELKSSSADKSVLNLLRDLTPARTKNVAICAIGSKFDAVAEIKQIITSKGIDVAGVHECSVKGGLFKKAAVTEADLGAAVAWAGKIVDAM